MPRLELSGLSRKIFLDMKLHQLQIQIPALDLASSLPEKILFTLNMDEVTRGSISMAQLDLCPLGQFILFNGLGFKTHQPTPQTSVWPWGQNTTNHPSTGPPAARRQGGPPGKQLGERETSEATTVLLPELHTLCGLKLLFSRAPDLSCLFPSDQPLGLASSSVEPPPLPSTPAACFCSSVPLLSCDVLVPNQLSPGPEN